MNEGRWGGNHLIVGQLLMLLHTNIPEVPFKGRVQKKTYEHTLS